MGIMNVTGSKFGPGLALLGVMLGLSGCASSSGTKNPGQSADSGQPPGDDGGGTGSNAGLTNCMSGDTAACSSFTTPTGTMIALGPYGAQMDVNVGKGYETAVASSDVPGSTQCQTFASIFMEDPNLTAKLLQTSQNGITIDFSLYTVYRPAIWKAGETYPVITWANGTCAQPEGYGALLRYVASYGYFVVAANTRQVGTGSPPPMLHALDFAAAANMDPSSPYYQKLDMTKVGGMGHSQGGAATVAASSDSRIQDVIIFNALGGGSSTVAKPFLAISGDMDIGGQTAASMSTAVNSAAKAAFLYYHKPSGMGPLRGHLVLMLTPDRVEGATVAWWQMMFRSDATSRNMFVGSSCGLCNQASDFDFGEHGLD
jgi:hypothetical protein